MGMQAIGVPCSMWINAMEADANEGRIDKGGTLVKANVNQLSEKALEKHTTQYK